MASTSSSSIDLLKADFLRFLRYVFVEVLNLPPPSAIQNDIARFLVAGGNPRKFIQAFRGVGKSYITCIYVVWRLWTNPYLKVVVASADLKGARLNASLIRQIINHPAGDNFWPELRTRKDQDSNILAFDVGACADRPAKEKSVNVLSIGGSLAGNRGHLMLLDDIENTNNSQTEGARETLRLKIPEFINMMIPSEESGIIVLGTPQSMDTVYKDFGDKGYQVRVWTQRYPLASKIDNYGGTLAPLLLERIAQNPALSEPTTSRLAGAPVERRFTDQKCLEQEVENGAGGYALQYLLDTELSDADKYPLKTSDLIVMDVDREVAPFRVTWGSDKDHQLDLANVGFKGDRYFRPFAVANDMEQYTGSVMHIDPSGRGRDETAYCVSKFLNGYIHIRRLGGLKGTGYSPENLERLAEIAKEEAVNLVLVEENMGSGMFGELLRPHFMRVYPVTVSDYRVSGQKEHRVIDTLAPVMASHKLVIDLGVIRMDARESELARSAMYQLTHITRVRGALKHDDRVDALASAVGYWRDQMAVNEEKADELRRQRAWDEHRRQFRRDVGRPADPPKLASQSRAPGRRRA